jgi:hypothetical protein
MAATLSSHLEGIMIFNGRSLNEINLDDLRLLVDNRVPESFHLEFKQTAYGRAPDERREMLRDITALANADGGYLIIGMREDASYRAAEMTPIDNAQQIAQAMRQACMDGIRDRVEALEIKDYENRRYDTDKRAMTITEIRELVLLNPQFRRLVELEIQGQELGSKEMVSVESAPPYVQLLTERPVERFLNRYLTGGTVAQSLVVVSPYISELDGSAYDLQDVLKKVVADRTRLYVITQPPREEYQRSSMAVLEKCPKAEIRYNTDIHAKLYVCWSREESECFALFGSGNLTKGGLRHNIELGMMIFPRGYGRTLLRELYQWGSYSLRATSSRVKAASFQGGRNELQ